MRNEPSSNEPLRPIRSTKNNRKKRQEMTLHRPKKPLRRRASFPAPTEAKICGETEDWLALSLYRKTGDLQYAREVFPVSWTPVEKGLVCLKSNVKEISHRFGG